MRKFMLLFSMLLLCVGAFAATKNPQKEGLNIPQLNSDVGTMQSLPLQEVMQLKCTNQIAIQLFSMTSPSTIVIKKDDFINKISRFNFIPKHRILSKYWCHCKMGGNQFIDSYRLY